MNESKQIRKFIWKAEEVDKGRRESSTLRWKYRVKLDMGRTDVNSQEQTERGGKSV